jgi:biotin-dependent carboxylase-like uncharacterized protein
MIEVINPGWLSIVVDGGRYGYADIGVPGSAALDQFAYNLLSYLVGNSPGDPALEVMGSEFCIRFATNITCAITGANVDAYLDDTPVAPWTSFVASEGSTLRIKEVLEGFRYYIGFSGCMDVDRVIGSFSTNLECRFGGYRGRPLIKGDQIKIEEPKTIGERFIPGNVVPSMDEPHVLRVIEGSEIDHFTRDSVSRLFDKTDHPWYIVSAKSNRTGIRLEGKPLLFKKGADKSIISEGILPGTIQVPGDGMPILMLYERTIGGYARIGVVAKVDHDRLAHLRPKDRVVFHKVDMDEAERLWRQKVERYYAALPQ